MTVEELLHDAEHADSGAAMARMMGDSAYVKQAIEKRDRLVREALAIDPSMQDEAWAEVDPAIRKIGALARDGGAEG